MCAGPRFYEVTIGVADTLALALRALAAAGRIADDTGEVDAQGMPRFRSGPLTRQVRTFANAEGHRRVLRHREGHVAASSARSAVSFDNREAGRSPMHSRSSYDKLGLISQKGRLADASAMRSRAED